MRYREFKEYREKINKKILQEGTLNTKRFFSLDESVYLDRKLSRKTKELLGLVASVVLRCNDCILYHLDKCIDEGYTNEELYEALDVALIVGGSITIPHIRYAYEMIDEIRKEKVSE
ncbi:MAG: carboxymuconolactone decarboxylase family protein [Thermoplasmatales archaeon]|nr:carboxymuconolactone decarboxylase family protein [Thermoplasmatales archaeon]